jgi:hypothetical protein
MYNPTEGILYKHSTIALKAKPSFIRLDYRHSGVPGKIHTFYKCMLKVRVFTGLRQTRSDIFSTSQVRAEVMLLL